MWSTTTLSEFGSKDLQANQSIGFLYCLKIYNILFLDIDKRVHSESSIRSLFHFDPVSLCSVISNIHIQPNATFRLHNAS